MTTTRFTKEQLIEWARERKSQAEDFPGVENAEKDLVLAEIALASLTAKPVAWTDADELRDANNGGSGYLFSIGGDANKFADPRRQLVLYTAPPAQVVHQEPIAWLNDAYLARGVVDGEAGSEDAGPGYIPVYREPLYAVQPVPVVPDERAAFNAWNNDTDCPLAGLTVKQAAWLAWLKRSGTIKSFGNDEEFEPVSNRDELLPSIKPAPELDSVAKNAKSPPSKYPVITDEVLSAIRKVARIRTDLNDFDGDRRGIADCLDEAEQELIVTINEHAAMLQGAEQLQSAQQNIPEIIPGGLVEAVNNLLNNDGSRGRYSAIGCGEARERIELWLAQRHKWESQRSENLCAGNSPVIPEGWVMVPVDMTPEQMRAVQLKSELGSYAAANLSGAYSLFREFWDVAIAAAPQQEAK